MAKSSKQQTDSSISSVRSNISDASSGYAFVSVPGKERCDIRDVYPKEPPPDYEHHSPSQELSAQATLLVQSSPTEPTCESNRPLLSHEKQREQADGQTRTLFRINSSDINIEIVSNAYSPNSTHTDSAFFPQRKHEGCSAICKCSKSKTVKCLLALLLVLTLALILVIVNFTVCIADFTSACK